MLATQHHNDTLPFRDIALTKGNSHFAAGKVEAIQQSLIELLSGVSRGFILPDDKIDLQHMQA